MLLACPPPRSWGPAPSRAAQPLVQGLCHRTLPHLPVLVLLTLNSELQCCIKILLRLTFHLIHGGSLIKTQGPPFCFIRGHHQTSSYTFQTQLFIPSANTAFPGFQHGAATALPGSRATGAASQESCLCPAAGLAVTHTSDRLQLLGVLHSPSLLLAPS